MNSDTVIAFDIYGTLVNTSGISHFQKEINAKKVDSMVEMWRNKQLEYSFRQTAMNMYKGFSFCTETALDYTCKYHNVELTETQKTNLLNAYRKLPVFKDVEETLDELKKKYRLYAFSNGESKTLNALLNKNSIADKFVDIISVENTKHFKPSTEVYAYFNEATNTQKEDTYLVSSNPFDIIGAKYFGFKTIWVQRTTESIFDSWGITPDYTINTLKEIINLNI